MNDRPAIIRAENFSCRYDSDAPLALRRIELEIQPGEFVVVLGPSGGGKSTLALAVNGIIPHELRSSETAGEVFVEGLAVSQRPPHELMRAVGTVLQDPEWQLTTFTVADELAFAAENLGFPPVRIHERVAEVARLLHLENLLDRSPDELSGGEKQRVAIAACLVPSPPVLLLDEPLSELDPIGKQEVIATVRDLNTQHGSTVLFIEHNLHAVAPYADRVIVVAGGSVIAAGPPRAILADRVVAATTGLRLPQPVEIAELLGIQRSTMPLTMSELVSVAGGMPGGAVGDTTVSSAADETPTTDATPALTATDLRFAYPGGADVVAGVDLHLREGEYVGLIGANGAGKSTVARLLVGLLTPQHGTIRLRDEPLRGMSRREISSRIGYVFQNPDYQFFSRTCRDEVAVGLRLHDYSAEEAKELATAVLDELGMAKFADHHPHFLSRGQRRRVAVASMLAMRPQVLVLDEPTTGLDSGAATAMLDLVDELRDRGHAVLLLTHEMWAVLERCDRVVMLDDGRVRLDDDPRRAFARHDVLAECGITAPPLAELFELLPGGPPALLPRTSEDAAALLDRRSAGNGR